jgi:hypothetical protein
MTCHPPVQLAPSPRGHIAGRRGATVLCAILTSAMVVAACNSPVEDSAGLLGTAGGRLQRLDAAGELHAVTGLPPDVRHVASAGGTIVVATDNERYLVASPTSPGVEGVTWRELEIELPATGFTAGIDISPDGRSLAVVRAHDDASVLDLVVVDLESGRAQRREEALAANGPPSWLADDALALDVIGPDDHTTQARVALPDGEPLLSASRGFALAASADGRRIAVADDSTESVGVTDPSTWWAGRPADAAVPYVRELAVQDTAIDTDGTRIAVVYAHGDDPSWTIRVYRLSGDRWQPATSFDVESDAPPTIDWLEWPD